MTHHIFLSWQSDTPNAVGRNLVERCLERAIGTLQADADIEPADRDMAVDRDTLDVPGSPPIMEIIFEKIDRAAVFVGDLTFVAERAGGGRIPNPNVCVEQGWALKALTWRRVIAVMNTTFGHPDEFELPFDFRHTRRPILFHCPADANLDQRREAREGLTKDLVKALKAIFGDKTLRDDLKPAALAAPHPHDVQLLERVHRQLPLGLRRFLHLHSFGTPFRVAVLDPIHEMNETWVGAAFEFEDAAIQASFTALRTGAAEFGALIGERIYAVDNNSKLGTPKTDEDRAIGLQPGTTQAIRDMDAKAAALSSLIDDFERIARRRIPVASGVHAEADRPAGPDPRRESAQNALQELAFDAHRGALPEIVPTPRLTLRIAPFAAAEGQRLDPKAVAEAQLRFPRTPLERVVTDSDGHQWWTCAVQTAPAVGGNKETAWRMRLVRPGNLEFQATIGWRKADDRDILVEGRRLEGDIVHTLERMARIATGLGLGGAALLAIALDGVEDVELTRPRGGAKRIRHQEISLPVVTVEDLGQPVAEALHEALDILWQSARWSDGSPSFGGDGWAGYTDLQNYGEP